MGFGSVISIFGSVGNLDTIANGATYRKVAGVDGAGKITSASIANGAVQGQHIGNNVITSAHTVGLSASFMVDGVTYNISNGLVVSSS